MKSAVVGGVVVVLAGAAAWGQMAIKDAVTAGIDQQLDPAYLAQYAGMPVDVEVLKREDGLFASTGTALMTMKENGLTLSMEMDYDVSHSLLAAVSGVPYQVAIRDIKADVEGDEININDEVWDGESIQMAGVMTDAESGNSVVTMPAINKVFDAGTDGWGNPQQFELLVPTFDINLDMKDANKDSMNYTVATSVTDVVVKTADGEMTFNTVDYQQSTERSKEKINSEGTFTIASVTTESANPMQNMEMKGISIKAQMDLSEQLNYESEFHIGEVSSPMGAANDFFLDSRIAGIDGEQVRELIAMLEQSNGLDPQAKTESMMLYLQERADALLAPGPVLQVKSGVKVNGENFYDVDGEANLKTDQLPADYFAQMLNPNGMADRQLLVHSMAAELDAKLSPTVAMMASQLHPLIAEKAFNGEDLKFVMKDGVVSLNDEPLF